MTKKTKPEIDTPKPLLPLEYCRPERAAELLGCKVEDIFHWAAIGAIRLYVMAQKAERPSHIYVKKHQYLTYLGRSNPLKFGASFVATSLDEELGNDWCNGKATISGFWAIRRLHFEHWEMDGVLTARDGDIFELSSDFSDNSSPVWADVKFPNIADHLWVLREDLALLQRHIHSGQPLPIGADANAQSALAEIAAAAAGESQPHPTAEYHASTRERVLVAALHARSRWPDECVTYIAWANALWDHSNELFGGNDAPLSRESIQRLLSAAEGRNEVYKRG